MIYRKEIWEFEIKDPYLKQNIYSDPTICPSCGLVYHNKRWIRNEELKKKFEKEKKVEYKKCPACRKIEDKYPLGEVKLSGKYLFQHKEEIKNLINNVVEREQNINPLARIMEWKENEEGFEITTTTDTLAKKIGLAVYKACKGEIDIQLVDGHKYIRIKWRRD